MATPPTRTTATLLESKPMTEEIMWFRFRLAVPVAFKVGQYVSLRFPGEQRFHAFSISSSPAKRDEVELIIKKCRDFTCRLFTSPPGTELEAILPLGLFMQHLEGDVVMVAGGVGVTPFLAMVRYARDLKLQDRHYWLFYSARTRADIMFEQELRGMGAANPNVHIVFTITREQPAGWDGGLGRFDVDALLRYLGGVDGKSYYSCGPTEMVNAVVEMLKGMGVAKERIFQESWG
jgi:glycine betaine catabolism B